MKRIRRKVDEAFKIGLTPDVHMHKVVGKYAERVVNRSKSDINNVMG